MKAPATRETSTGAYIGQDTPILPFPEHKNELQVQAENVRPQRKGSRIGFVDIRFPQIGLELSDCTVHRSHESRWVNLPAGAYEKDRKLQWASVARFTGKQAREAFRESAVQAVRELLNRRHKGSR